MSTDPVVRHSRLREHGRSCEDAISMVRSGGVDGLDVLRFATSGGAHALNLAGEVGQLTAGAADVIAVPGKPWEAIETLRDVCFVMQAGRVIVSGRQR